MASRKLVSLTVGCTVVVLVLLLTAVPAGAQTLPPLPGQHAWSHRGQGSRRGGLSPATGPASPVLQPAEWPYPVDGYPKADPVVDAGGSVYVGSTSGVFYALHPSAPTTEELVKWQFEADGPIRSAAAIKSSYHGDDPVRITFTTADGHVYSVDTEGNLVWDLALGASVDARSAPALARSFGNNRLRIYLATDDGVYALEETALGPSPGVDVLWHDPAVKSSRSVALSPDGERVYATADGTFYVLQTQPWSGSQILEQQVLEGQQLTGPVVDEDDRAYVGADDGTIYRISAPGAIVLNSEALGDPITYEPALAPGDQLAVASGDRLHVTHRSLITHTWSFTPTTWDVTSELAVDGAGTVFLAGDDVQVHAVRGGSEAWAQPISGNGYASAPALTREGRLYVGTSDSDAVGGDLHAIQSEPSLQTAFDGDVQDGSTVDIYSIRSAYGITGTVRRLTDDPTAEYVPAYSTLGELMAFTSDRHGLDQDVFLGTAGAAGLRNVTVAAAGTPFQTDESEETDAAFSPTDQNNRSLLPDGTRYLAVTTGFEYDWGLFFIDLDTLLNAGTVTGVNLPGFLQAQGASAAASQVPFQQAQAAFSPDGRWLAYGACVEAGGPRYELRAVDLLQDSQSIVVTESTDNCEQAAGFHPFFSPDSRHLAYRSDSGVFVTDDMSQPGTRISSSTISYAPAWSPDGTEIVYHSSLFLVFPFPRFEDTLRTFFGPQYVSSTLVSGVNASNGAYHPRRLPEPETGIARCNAQNTLSPTSQQPGKLITIRGCGFDVRFPENNTVIFPEADGPGVIRTEAVDTGVTFSTGLGVITAEVPLLAGDGPIVVETPFGSESLADTFHVEPLVTALRMRETVPNAYIRLMGYGFETDDLSSYQVRFGAPGASTVAPTAIRLETCSDPETPCDLSQHPSGKIGWLEVQVPSGADGKPVTVERTIGGAVATSSAPDPIMFLSPQVDVSPDTGSAGDEDLHLAAVQFDFEGSGFPYDPYFGYTQVDLYQVDPAMPESSLGTVTVDAFNRFSRTGLDVQTNSGGRLSMAARLPAQQTSGTLVSASTPFTTPLKDLPIVFVPGTSGTFLKNTGGTFRHGACGAFAACQVAGAIGSVTSGGLLGTLAGVATATACAPHHPNDFQAGENVWLNGHALVHILVGCSNWLDAIKLEPNSNQGVFPQIQIGDVIDEVKTPAGADDKEIYKGLFDFIQNDMNRSLVRYGSSCPSGETDCLYLFNQDWRLGMETASQRLDTLINRVLQETGQPRVLIVTHSYGGPTANYYLRTVPNAPSKVDQVITLGGGHMGVVRPYKALEVGDSWEIEFLEVLRLKKKNVQEIARDWPTAYWQMPQSNWFDDPNQICPTEKDGDRDCSWVEADWDATTPIRQGNPPGELNRSSSTYAFIEDSVAYNPFRGSSLNRYAANVNAGKFQTAQDRLLDLSSSQNDATLSCSETSAAGLGDWRCGTQGVFFQRIVGFGTDTTVRVRFPAQRICAFKGELFGVSVDACFTRRWIEPYSTTEGDSTIPLRSAVGILSPDGSFDTRDSRIWGLDGARTSDFDGDGTQDDAKFHSSLPRIPSVHTFIQHAAQGKLTDISQIEPQWQDDDWPLMVPCGVPDAQYAPSGTPKDANCYGGTSPQDAGASAQATPDYWTFELTGDAPIYARNQNGEGVGPLPELPQGAIAQLPGVGYESNPGFTRIQLPYDSGVYTVTIEGDPTDSDVAQLDDLIQLQVFPTGDGDFPLTMHSFLGVPISDTTRAQVVWDTGEPPADPALRVDFAGDGEIVRLSPDTTLNGAGAGDATPPTSTITVDDDVLTIDATDDGGAGVHQIVYGTDRGHARGQLYSGPVELPPDATYVWAFAVDAAGNTQAEDTVYATCDLPTDFDGDGQVAEADVNRVASVWTSDWASAFDLNVNDHVDVGDVQRTAATLGASCDGPAALSAVAPQQSDATLRVESPPTVALGSTFTVAVAVEQPENLAGFEATLAYNPLMLTLRDVALADALGGTARTADLLGPIRGSSQADGSRTIHLGGYSYGEGPGLDDGGVLARLTFEATAFAEGSFVLTHARLADVEGALSTPATEDDGVYVESSPTLYLPLLLRQMRW